LAASVSDGRACRGADPFTAAVGGPFVLAGVIAGGRCAKMAETRLSLSILRTFPRRRRSTRKAAAQVTIWNSHIGTPKRNDHMPSSDAGKASGPNRPKKNIAKLPKWMDIHIQ
jgi:hypothetical protein